VSELLQFKTHYDVVQKFAFTFSTSLQTNNSEEENNEKYK